MLKSATMWPRNRKDSEPKPQIENPEDEQTVDPEGWRTMSVVDIPGTYDPQGLERLYDRFEASLEKHGLMNEPIIWWAMRTAFAVHSYDKRTNGHYVEHLMIVALEVLEDYGITDADSDLSHEEVVAVVAAALLHDSIEDHPKDLTLTITGEDISDANEHTARIKAHAAVYGEAPLVADIVLADSNPIIEKGEDGEPLEDKHVVYTEHTQDLLTNPINPYPKAGLVKLSDFRHNAVNNHLTKGPLRRKLDEKYVKQYEAYIDFIYSPHSPIKDPLKRQEIAHDIMEGYGCAIARIQQDEKEEERQERQEQYDEWRANLVKMAARIAIESKNILHHIPKPKIGAKYPTSFPEDSVE